MTQGCELRIMFAPLLKWSSYLHPTWLMIEAVCRLSVRNWMANGMRFVGVCSKVWSHGESSRNFEKRNKDRHHYPIPVSVLIGSLPFFSYWLQRPNSVDHWWYFHFPWPARVANNRLRLYVITVHLTDWRPAFAAEQRIRSDCQLAIAQGGPGNVLDILKPVP
jgi:hypothetical protein